MKISLILTTGLAGLSNVAAQAANRTATNSMGSTPAQRATIDHAQTQIVINAALKRATELQTTLSIAVVDAAAHLVGFLRIDNAYLATIDVAQKKARTVALFNGQAPSSVYYNLTQPGGALWSLQETNGGLVPLSGGQPIIDHEGRFIGAVGASGGYGTTDVEVAVYAAQSVGTTIEV